MCISSHTPKNTWHIDVVDPQMYNRVWYSCIYLHGLSLNGWHDVFSITNNRHDVTITTHAIKRHFLIWITTVRQPTKRRCSCVLTLKYTFICVYWWTRQRIHNTLIVVDLYQRPMGDKTIPDSAEPRLESFYPTFVAGIDLPHQGVVDSYNLGLCTLPLQITMTIPSTLLSVNKWQLPKNLAWQLIIRTE